ncbi:zwilch kinetochore protein [Oratosquilla oratoria]|uniref:zwilch kinetochore protein n=1 Tax=Oratosquilla oratoria TaxID=337810 RepID=UPI003F76F9DC
MESNKIGSGTENTPTENIAKELKRLSSSAPGSSCVISYEGEKFWVQNEVCPEYMKTGNNKDGPVLLIQKFSPHLMAQENIDRIKTDTPGENTFSSTPSVMKIKKDSDDLDVTGTPLKCPFAFDVREFDMSPFTIALPCSKKKRKNNYIPYGPDAARKIMSYVYQELKKASDDTDCLPVWIACDGSDRQKTLFIGTRYKKLDATHSIVQSSGPHKGKDELPLLNDLKMQLTFGSKTKRVCSVATAEYTKPVNAEEMSSSSSVTISCSWKEPLCLLSLPTLGSSVTITAHIVPEDSSSVMHQMYEEVTFLKGLVDGLSTGEVVWLISDDEKTIQEQLEDVFEMIREKGSQEKGDDGDDDGHWDNILKQMFFKCRKTMDFTDRLWIIMMKCHSYHALVDALTYVFEAVLSGKIRPQIHLQSRTQVGRLIRSLMQWQESSLPDLSGLKPLEMLIEMGIEKVKRDCISIFQDCSLATGEQLAWFVESGSSYAETMMRIDRLSVALHAVMAMRSFLDLGPEPLVQFTAQVLNDVRKSEIGNSYTFVFPLQISYVRELLDNWSPTTWEVTMHHVEKTVSHVKKCRVTAQPVVDYNKNDDTLAEELKDEEVHYFCTLTTHIKDSLFT